MFKIDKKFTQANISRTIRFTEELFEELGEIAKYEGVSLNELVLRCCRYALDNYEKRTELKEQD